MKDRDVSLEHLAQARRNGYEAFVLTVDTAVSGAKWQDRRNGFSIPPALTLRTFADMARRPGGWATSSPPSRCGSRPSRRARPRPLGDVQHPARAGAATGRHRLAHRAVAGSGRGQGSAVGGGCAGRRRRARRGGALQPRRAPARPAPVPLDLLPHVVEAIGDRAEVMVDSGIRTGSDVAAAVPSAPAR